MIVQCCVCQRIHEEGQWRNDPPGSESVTHTYCPKCAKEALVAHGLNPDVITDRGQAA